MRRIYLLFLAGFLALSQLSAQTDCEINNLVAEPQPCVNGEFMVDIDLTVINPQGDSFGVVGNATIYGNFAYADLPVTLGPLTGDDETEWEFIVFDLEEPNCQATAELGIVTCCNISNVAINPQTCQNQETFSAVINFTFELTEGQTFTVFDINGDAIGSYNYSDLPVTVVGIPSTGNQPNEITICDGDSEFCCTTVEFDGLDCDPTDCEIYDVVATPGECIDGDFFVTLDFEFENVGNFFRVRGNGNNYGLFSYDDVPITLGPFDGDSTTVYEFLVSDNAIDGCSDDTFIEPVGCPEPCGFNDLTISTEECQGNEAYSISIDFNPVSTGDQGFQVSSGGELLGQFDYNALPILIDSFPASGDFFDTLVICDIVDTTCCDTVQFQALLCAGCVIYNVEATNLGCDTMTQQFMVEIDFQFQNVSDSFLIGGNGNTYGTWAYTEVPVILGPFDGDDSTEYEFVVFDLDNGFCLDGTDLGTVNCIDPCTIGAITVDSIECSGDGTYDLLLDFAFENVDSLGFDVFAGDQFIGFYLYDSLPVLIEDFPSSGNPNDVITVCDNDNPECCSVLEFPSPGCFPVCEIRDIVVEALECTTDSTFSILIEFIHEDLPTDSVDIFSFFGDIGRFSVNDLPIQYDSFPSGITGASIVVQATDGSCDNDAGFDALYCDTTCAITNIDIVTTECNDDGTYDMDVTFDTEDVDNAFVDIWVDTIYLGFFPLNSQPVSLANLPGDGQNSTLVICENDNAFCCDTLEFEAPLCEVVECDIRDITIDSVECIANSEEFQMVVDFVYEGFSNPFFEVYNNEDFIGFYAVDSLPVLVSGIPGEGDIDTLVICENDNPDCCDTLIYQTPECEIAGCEIFDIAVDSLECQGDGTFTMNITFDYSGLTGDSVEVRSNNQFLGVFHRDSLPLRVSGVSGTGANAVLEICDRQDEECCSILEYETPECTGCVILNLTADITECTSDTTFGAFIDFETSGLDSNGVDIYADDEFLGFFPLVTPLLISNIPSGDGAVLLEVCSADTFPEPICCTAIEIDRLNCEGTSCPIGAVTVEASECDTAGFFTVELDIDLTGNPEGSFIVAGNGTNYGAFQYGELPITLGPLEGDSTTAWEFIVIDLVDPDCSSFVELGIIDCGTSSLVNPSLVYEDLDIRYGDNGAFCLLPDRTLSVHVWSANGSPVRVLRNYTDPVPGGEILELNSAFQAPGIYFVLVETSEGYYAGKFVIAD